MFNYTKTALRITGSPIDRLMDKVTISHSNPIYLSVGSPSIENIPVQSIRRSMNELVGEWNAPLFSYEESVGDQQLRTLISTNERIPHENVLITSGCTQGLELISKLFVEEGDVVYIEDPTYCLAFTTMGTAGADIRKIRVDSHGMVMTDLERELEVAKKAGDSIKCIYVIPNAQNPTGVTLSVSRRIKLISLAKEYNFMIIEDDPYSELMFESDSFPSLYQLDTTRTSVVRLCSFSKTISPGFRVGWIQAHSDIIEKITKLKHSIDSCTNTISQKLITHLMASGIYASHVQNLRSEYKKKRDFLIRELEESFQCHEAIEWTRPLGGMFVWMKIKGMNTDVLFEHAIEEGVVFVPGSAFHPDGKPRDTLRLCFASVPSELIKEAVQRLFKAVLRMNHSTRSVN